MKIVFNQPINNSNQVAIVHNCHLNTNIMQTLLDEVDNSI